MRRLATGLVAQKGIEYLYPPLVVLGIEAWRRRRMRRRSAGVADAAAVVMDGPAEARRAWGGLALWNAALWLPALAWYAPIVTSRRLLFPIFASLVPPVLAVLAGWAGAAARTWAPRVARLFRGRRRPVVGLLLLSSIALVVLSSRLLWLGGAPGTRRPIDEIWLQAARAMRDRCPAGSRVLVRPSRDYPPDWLLEGHVEYVALPWAVADADVAAWIERHVDFLLVNISPGRSRAPVADLAASHLVRPGGDVRWMRPTPQGVVVLVPATLPP